MKIQVTKKQSKPDCFSGKQWNLNFTLSIPFVEAFGFFLIIMRFHNHGLAYKVIWVPKSHFTAFLYFRYTSRLLAHVGDIFGLNWLFIPRFLCADFRIVSSIHGSIWHDDLDVVIWTSDAVYTINLSICRRYFFCLMTKTTCSAVT